MGSGPRPRRPRASSARRSWGEAIGEAVSAAESAFEAESASDATTRLSERRRRPHRGRQRLGALSKAASLSGSASIGNAVSEGSGSNLTLGDPDGLDGRKRPKRKFVATDSTSAVDVKRSFGIATADVAVGQSRSVAR